MGDDVDYVTINPAVAYDKYNVVVMRFDRREDTHVVARISEPLSRPAAESLAKSWAAATQLEVR